MKASKSTLTACLLVTVLACCISNKKTTTMDDDYVKKMLNIYKLERRYKSNPVYGFEYSKAACFFEVYLNDIPVFFDYFTGQSDGNTWNFDCILTSGTQHVKVKVFPQTKDDEAPRPIPRNAHFKMRIYHEEVGNSGFGNDHTVKVFEMPSVQTDAPYLEFTFDFEASVPYNLAGWSNSVDLTKEDTTVLKKEVIAVYQEFENAYLKNDLNQVCRMLYNRHVELQQVYYDTELSGAASIVDHYTAEMKTVVGVMDHTNTRLRVFGNGKVVALAWIKGENRGYLGVDFTLQGDESMVYEFLLHRPKAGSHLEIIR